MFIDKDELKARVSYSQAISVLQLNVVLDKGRTNVWRGPCPVCKAGGDRALVITEGRGYFCFADKAGGDQIALVMHILSLSFNKAAQHLAQATGTVPSTSNSTVSTVPQSETAKETQKFQPLSYLEADHPAVVAIGFDTDFAKKTGIGYAPKGILRGTVAIPFRDETGALLGYIGVTDAKLPPSFTPNVVELKRPA